MTYGNSLLTFSAYDRLQPIYAGFFRQFLFSIANTGQKCNCFLTPLPYAFAAIKKNPTTEILPPDYSYQRLFYAILFSKIHILYN